MTILSILILAWLLAAASTTFAWVGFVEVCRWQQRRQVSAAALTRTRRAGLAAAHAPHSRKEATSTSYAFNETTEHATTAAASHPYPTP